MRYGRTVLRFKVGGKPPDAAGFTLIELLIVVAIIGILAAIAIPNFLEAQVRAKVARVRSDLRTIATALEAYAVDHHTYPPNDGQFNIVPIELTTPVAFLTTGLLVDPFSEHEVDTQFGFGDLAKYYTYDRVVTFEELQAMALLPDFKSPSGTGVDGPMFNPGAREKYGHWRLVSNGPDREYADPDFKFGSDPLDPNGVLQGSDVPYDATNGSNSKGNLLRFQNGKSKP